jgi:hypothetical protein
VRGTRVQLHKAVSRGDVLTDPLAVSSYCCGIRHVTETENVLGKMYKYKYKYKEGAEQYVMRSFIICTIHIILATRCSQ